ncbi:MAG: AraC family ligand binding domain-containing protein [Bacteroidota bacterium]
MDSLKQYHLNKFNQSKLHFEIKNAANYLATNKEKAVKPHKHSYYQLIWFKSAGDHYVDYEVIQHPENTLFLINKGQVHYFCPDSSNQGFIFHFNDIFLAQYDHQLLKRLSSTLFSEIFPSTTFLNVTDVNKMNTIAQMLVDEWEQQERGFGEMMFHLFSLILLQAERKLENTSSVKTASEEFVLANNFKGLIKEKIHEFWGVDHFVQELSTNEKALVNATKSIFLKHLPGLSFN